MNEIRNETNIQTDNKSMSWFDFWHLIWDYKWYYVQSVAFCIIVALLYLYVTPSQYLRIAKVIVKEDAQGMSVSDIFSMTEGSGVSMSSNTNNEAEAFASPDLMEKVVRRLSLETVYYEDEGIRNVEMYGTSPVVMTLIDSLVSTSFSFRIIKTGETGFILEDFTVGPDKIKGDGIVGSLAETVDTPVGKIRIEPTLNIDKWDKDILVFWANPMARAKGYASRLTVTVIGKNSTVLTLSLEDRFQSRADRILDALIDVHSEEWIYDKNLSARNTTEFINDRIKVVEKELSAIEADLKAYKEDNSLTDVKAIGQAYLDELGNVSTSSFNVENQLAMAGYIRDYLMDPKNARSLLPSNSGLESNGVESQIENYNKLFLEREKLVSNSSENNPLIVDMTQSLDAIRSAILSSIDNLISTLKIEAQQIENERSRLMSDMSSSSGLELDLLSIERQQQVKQSLYLYLLQQREENEIVSLINVGNTRLIVSPNGSNAPASPNSMLILLVSVILGCAIPFVILFIIKSMDTSVRCREDIASLNIPFLAEIPLLSGKKKWKFLKMSGKENDKSEIVVRHGERNTINEAFRVLRTNMDFMTGRDGNTKVIMVSSFNPGSGKTFITMNLAASYAVKGSKVIVLDLDLRKGSLGKSLGLHNDGLSMYLSGNMSDMHSITEKIQENLYAIPSGILPPNPSELLLTERFRKLISDLREEYDYVFLDCPPVDIVADTAIIAGVADMTVFVARAGLLDKRALPLVSKIVEGGIYPRLSLILNYTESELVRYGYGRYGYGYGYGYNDGK